MIAPELEAYFRLRLEWKLEVEPETKTSLRRQLDAMAERICREHNLALTAREFFDATRPAFMQWARRSEPR